MLRRSDGVEGSVGELDRVVQLQENMAVWGDIFTPVTSGLAALFGDVPVCGAPWYISSLAALGEKPLETSTPDHPPTYRLHTIWSYQPFIVRLTEVDGDWQLFCKCAEARASTRPLRLVGTTERELSVTEGGRFVSLVEEAGFWKMPAFDGGLGFDGLLLVLEGVRAGRHHAVCRWSPRHNPFAELVGFLTGLLPVAPEPPPPAPKYLRSFAELEHRLQARSKDT